MQDRCIKRANRYKDYTYKNDKQSRKHVDPNKKTQEEKSSMVVSENRLATKYGITFHCCLRYAQRILSNNEHLYNSDVESIAKDIKAMLPFDLDEAVNGIYPFIDHYKIVVRNNMCITIK